VIALPEIVSPTTQAAKSGLSAVSPNMRSAVSGLGNRRPPKVMSAIAVGRMIRPSKSKNARSLEDNAALVPANAKAMQPKNPPQAAVGSMSRCLFILIIVRLAEKPREQHRAKRFPSSRSPPDAPPTAIATPIKAKGIERSVRRATATPATVRVQMAAQKGDRASINSTFDTGARSTATTNRMVPDPDKMLLTMPHGPSDVTR